MRVRQVSLDAAEARDFESGGHRRDRLEFQADAEGAGLLVDWFRLLQTLRLSEAETDLVLARIRGEGRLKLAEKIGTEAVERLRKRVWRRLRVAAGETTGIVTVLKVDPSRTARKIRLPCGGVLWEHR